MRREESGFTLVELLVVITVLVIIVGAIGTAVIVALRNLDSTQTRMSESHDAQMAAAYVVTDAQSAASIATTQPKCGSTTATIASLSWTDQGIANAVTYVLETANGERRLRRTHVVGTTPTEVVVAHHLTPTCGTSTLDDPAVAVSSTTDRLVLTLTDATGYQFSVTGERRAR